MESLPGNVQERDYKEVFKLQMPLCNEHLGTMPHIRTELSGSTAIVAILEDNGLLTVANVGDSRCILGQLRNRRLEVVSLSTDHTPDVPEEVERILSKNVSPPPDLPANCSWLVCGAWQLTDTAHGNAGPHQAVHVWGDAGGAPSGYGCPMQRAQAFP